MGKSHTAAVAAVVAPVVLAVVMTILTVAVTILAVVALVPLAVVPIAVEKRTVRRYQNNLRPIERARTSFRGICNIGLVNTLADRVRMVDIDCSEESAVHFRFSRLPGTTVYTK